MPSRPVDAQIAAQARLRAIVVSAVAAAWAQQTAYDEQDVETFLNVVVPIVLAGQHQAVVLTNAYLAALLDRPPLGVDIDKITGAALRAGATPAQVYRRPFVTVWSAMKAGIEYSDAVAAGMARAKATAAMDIQLAHRGALAAAQQADRSIFGYQRVADPDACDFCRAVNGAYVKSADAMALHNYCGCGLDPLTEVHRRAVFLPDGTRIREFQGGPLISTPLPPEVAVHEHGELGPVLGSPEHDFTTRAEALA